MTQITRESLGLKRTTTQENLEMEFSGMDGTMVAYGEYTIIAGFYYNGQGENNYFWAAYLFTSGDATTCEDEILLLAISDSFYEDDGHAIAAAFGWIAQQAA